MRVSIIFVLSTFFASCMHLGMMGNHEERSPEHPTFEKEVIAGTIKASATFPDLKMEKEVVFELRLEDTDSGRPISSAVVSFHSIFQHKTGPHVMHGENDSAHFRPNADHAVSFEKEVQESAEPGLYKATFIPVQSGEHRLMFHVWRTVDGPLDPDVVIETTRTVSSHDEGHGEAMMGGMSATSDYLVIGGALMGAMMIVMWATRGSIF